MIRDELNFGIGSFVGDIMQPDADFLSLSDSDQARYLGWVAACPVVEGLIDPTVPAGRGPEAMAKRYAAIAFWHGFIVREAWQENSALGFSLSNSENRVYGEPVGIYELNSVPANYHEEYSAIGKLVGFAAPRMLIEHMSMGKTMDERASRLLTATEAVQDAASWSGLSEAQFLARIAERLTFAGTPPERLLKYIAGKGWLDEHNGKRMFDKAMLAVRDYAPTVWEAYEALDDEGRKQQKLANFDPLHADYEPSQEELANLFNGIEAGIKQVAYARGDTSEKLNDYKQQTKVLMTGLEGQHVSGSGDTQSVEASLTEPIDQNYYEATVQVTIHYGESGSSSRGIVSEAWTVYKNWGSSRGEEYSLMRFPAELYPDYEEDDDTGSDLELEDEFYEDTTAIGIDDVAMLNRLLHTLRSAA